MGVGEAPPVVEEAREWTNCRNSAAVLVGRDGVEWLIISVWASPRWKRTANPRGLVFGSLLGTRGIPVELEKCTVIGVDGCVKCGASESVAASAVGVKTPVSMMPRE